MSTETGMMEPVCVVEDRSKMPYNPSWVRPTVQCCPVHGHPVPLPTPTPPVVVPAPPLDPSVILPSAIIHPAMQDGYYIFSKAFWENSSVQNAQSKLELIVQDFFDHEAISYERIHEVYVVSFRWNAIDSFYYIPILLVMMKVVVLTN